MKQVRIFALGFLLNLVVMLISPGNAPAQTAPTFVGVRTFLSAPYEPDLDKLQADFAVLGVPFDEGTWGQPGERYGPRDMRENSQEYAHDLAEGFYYIDGDRTVLKGKRWVDVGDVVIYPTVAQETNTKITEAVKKILAKKAFPVILGGDHSITFPVVRAYDIPLTIVHIDAHLDTWNGAKGNLDHASWVLRVAKLPTVKHITQVGMRGIANDQEAIGNARAIHTKIVTSEEIHRRGVAAAIEAIPQSDNIYISFDVDSMDPTLAPGTSGYCGSESLPGPFWKNGPDRHPIDGGFAGGRISLTDVVDRDKSGENRHIRGFRSA